MTDHPPSTRAATPRGKRTRDRIVTVAAELFHLKGVAATGLDEILTTAQAGKGQFYHYFTDKDDLVKAVVQLRTDQFRDEMTSRLEELDSWEGIRRWLDWVIESQADRQFAGGCPIGTLASERAEANPDQREALAAALGVKAEYLRLGLERMKERGELRGDVDPGRLAGFMVAVLQGALLVASVEKDPHRFSATISEGFDHLVAHGAPQ